MAIPNMFLALRRKWVDILCGRQLNSVLHQIIVACRDEAFFAMVLELAQEDADKNPINKQLIDFFSQGYVFRQILVIRRLVDKDSDVSSLRRVIDQMKEHRHLLTRENIIGHDGCPIDAALSERVYVESIDLASVDNQAVNLGDSDLLSKWSDSHTRNLAFDRICEKQKEGERSSIDKISADVFERMILEIESEPIKRIKNYVNDFVAHSIHNVNLQDPKYEVKFGDITASLKILAQIREFLSSCLLYESSSTLVPVFQYDHLAYLENPILPSKGVDRARKIWREKSKKIDEWVIKSENFTRFYN